MTKKKKQTTKQQQPGQPGIIKPDFSELIAKMRTEQPEPDQPETITVTPAQVETPAEQDDTGRQERVKRARELVQEQDGGSEGVLEGIDYPRGGPQTTPDVERQIEILQQAIEQGESIPVIAKRYGVSRQAIQHYIAQAKEEIELNSQLLDIKLVESLDSKIKEIVMAVDKSKLATATVRDLAIAAGIFLDKRKELLGPRSGTGNLRLRATFRGEGAIEVTTGDQ